VETSWAFVEQLLAGTQCAPVIATAGGGGALVFLVAGFLDLLVALPPWPLGAWPPETEPELDDPECDDPDPVLDDPDPDPELDDPECDDPEPELDDPELDDPELDDPEPPVEAPGNVPCEAPGGEVPPETCAASAPEGAFSGNATAASNNATAVATAVNLDRLLAGVLSMRRMTGRAPDVTGYGVRNRAAGRKLRS
jgi:hypothetical protein